MRSTNPTIKTAKKDIPGICIIFLTVIYGIISNLILFNEPEADIATGIATISYMMPVVIIIFTIQRFKKST